MRVTVVNTYEHSNAKIRVIRPERTIEENTKCENSILVALQQYGDTVDGKRGTHEKEK